MSRTSSADDWKDLVGHVSALSPRKVRTVVSVPMPGGPNSSLATLYAHLEATAPNVVAVRLECELLGTRQLVGTAAIPPGYEGVAVIATGIVASAWHGTAYGTLQQSALHLKLGVRPCCSGFAVSIPADLNTRLVPSLQTLVPAACMPLVRDQGAFNVWAGVAGAVPIAETERVTRIVCVTDAGGGSLSGLGNNIIALPGSREYEWQPRGNVEGPRTLTFAGTTYYSVEAVH